MTNDRAKGNYNFPWIALGKLYVFQNGLETTDSPFSVPVKDNEKSNSRSSSQRSNQSVSLRKPSGVRIFYIHLRNRKENWAPFNPCNGTLNTFPVPEATPRTQSITRRTSSLAPSSCVPRDESNPPLSSSSSSSSILIQPTTVVARSVSIATDFLISADDVSKNDSNESFARPCNLCIPWMFEYRSEIAHCAAIYIYISSFLSIFFDRR